MGYYRRLMWLLVATAGRAAGSIEAVMLGENKVVGEIGGDGPGEVARAQRAELAGKDTIMHAFGYENVSI